MPPTDSFSTLPSPDDYDSPWKEALERYFPAFLEFFFPQSYAEINWEQGYEFLDKELQQVVRDAALGLRLADKLVRVWRKGGAETWVLIHIEVQGQEQAELAERMFVYNYRIYDRYRRPVASFAVLGDERATWRPREFGYNLWGSEMRLRFPTVKLLDFADPRERLQSSTNPFAVLTEAHVQAQATRGQPATRLSAKLSLVKSLYRRGYSREEILELFRFIDWLLALPEELEQAFDRDLETFEQEEKMPYITSIERRATQRGREEGVEQGYQRGQLEELHSSIVELIADRLAAVPDDLRRRVEGCEDAEVLRTLRRRLLRAMSEEEIRGVLFEV